MSWRNSKTTNTSSCSPAGRTVTRSMAYLSAKSGKPHANCCDPVALGRFANGADLILVRNTVEWCAPNGCRAHK